MFKKIKREKKEVHSVIDIETAKNGDVLCIGLYNNTLEKVLHFYCWKDFYNFLEENNSNPYYQKLFAHNGGGFDWVHWFSWIFTSKEVEPKNIEVIMTGSTIIIGSLSHFENPVIFCDTLLTMKSSLNALCDVFKPSVPKLKDFDINNIEKIFKNDRELFLKYLDNDCISLFEIMEQFQQLLEIDFFPLTVASLGMYIFKLRFFKKETPLFKPTGLEDEFLVDSYAGGRVECFQQGIFEKVFTYDINSLYPFVMSFAEIPISTPEQTSEYIPGETGFYKITYKQTNYDVPPVLWKKTDKNGLVFSYEGSGVYSHHEIELLLKVGGEINVLVGLTYPETAPVFKEYVEYHYKLRKTFDKKHPMNLIAKYLLNCLYGKWGQKEETEKMVWLSDAEFDKMLDDGIPITDYDIENNLYIVEESRHVQHRIIYIASIITALARCEIFKYIEKYKDDLIYCDTDSIHLTRPMDFNIGDELGQMKPEESGKGVYLGRKMYGIDDKNEDKPKITFKGLTTKGNLPHDDLSIKDMEKIYYQDREQEKAKENCHLFTFSTFPKLKTVLQGRGKAGKMQSITKVLKKPEYTSNFRKTKCEWL